MKIKYLLLVGVSAVLCLFNSCKKEVAPDASLSAADSLATAAARIDSLNRALHMEIHKHPYENTGWAKEGLKRGVKEALTRQYRIIHDSKGKELIEAKDVIHSKFDVQGCLTFRSVSCVEDGKTICDTTFYMYQPSSAMLVETQRWKCTYKGAQSVARETYYTTYTYDEQGRLLHSETSITKDAQKTQKIKTFYDKKGRVRSAKSLDGRVLDEYEYEGDLFNGKICRLGTLHETYIYRDSLLHYARLNDATTLSFQHEFDEFGNWISRKALTKEGQAYGLEERIINYFR